MVCPELRSARVREQPLAVWPERTVDPRRSALEGHGVLPKELPAALRLGHPQGAWPQRAGLVQGALLPAEQRAPRSVRLQQAAEPVALPVALQAQPVLRQEGSQPEESARPKLAGVLREA